MIGSTKANILSEIRHYQTTGFWIFAFWHSLGRKRQFVLPKNRHSLLA